MAKQCYVLATRYAVRRDKKDKVLCIPRSLRWLEIVFIFPRLVLQILFQIQFGLSYQSEIYHSNK